MKQVIQNQKYLNEEQLKLLASDRPGYRSLYQTSFVSHQFNRKASPLTYKVPPIKAISFK